MNSGRKEFFHIMKKTKCTECGYKRHEGDQGFIEVIAPWGSIYDSTVYSGPSLFCSAKCVVAALKKDSFDARIHGPGGRRSKLSRKEQEHLVRLRARIAEVRASPQYRKMRLAQAKMEKELAKREGQPPQPGEVFVFRRTGFIALTHRHPDDEKLLYAVALDACNKSFVGTADIYVAAGKMPWEGVLHCGIGEWVKEAKLAKGKRAALLPEGVRLRAQGKLAEIARGKISASMWQRETDATSDYEDHIRELSAAFAKLPR